MLVRARNASISKPLTKAGFVTRFSHDEEGEAVLLDCASSPSHFFDVDGLEIKDAFASIASSIRKLRLTQ